MEKKLKDSEENLMDDVIQRGFFKKKRSIPTFVFCFLFLGFKVTA